MQSSTTCKCTHTYMSLGPLNKSILFFFSNPPCALRFSIQTTQVEPHKEPAPLQGGRPCRVSRPHTHHNAMPDLISCDTYGVHMRTNVRQPFVFVHCIALHACLHNQGQGIFYITGESEHVMCASVRLSSESGTKEKV
jgi:hypothetical protein